MYPSFIRDAIQSATKYYEYAKYNNTSRNIVNVIEISKKSNTTYMLQLHQKLKHTDSFGIQIISPFIKDEWYSIENQINANLYKVIKFDDKPPSILVEIHPPLSDIFEKIAPKDIKIVSDLKFLIEKVKKWYEDFGNRIDFPPHPLIDEAEIYFRGNEKSGKESAEQKKAVKTALSENISYIWGAPGTGKTQFVLADCLLTYIKKGERVIVLAPTNNAIEQTLLSVISTLQQQGESIDCLYRLGIASASFASKYPELCERLDHHAKVEELTQEKEFLEAKLSKEQKADRILESYNSFSSIFSSAQETNINLSDLNIQKENSESSRKIANSDINDLNCSVSVIENKIAEIDTEESSFAFRFHKIFSKEKHLENQYKKAKLQEELNSLKKELSELNTVVSELSIEIENLESEIQKELQRYMELSSNATTLLKQTFGSTLFESLRNANEYFIRVAEEAKNVVKDPSLIEKINIKEEEIQKLIEETETNFATKQVFAFTVDYFFSHYSYFLDNCQYEISHVFLDEAAYCPLIKSGILYSLNAPVTLLSDHMQLTPICMASDKEINDVTTKLFMWSQSAIYFPEIFDNNASLGKIFDSYNTTKNSKSIPPENNLKTAVLTKTHRFDNSLALILDQFVYQNDFKGISDKSGLSQTQIYYIHANSALEEKGQRTSSREVELIKEYLSYSDTKNCAVMTPYKKQRDLLQKQLGNLIDRDNILTVHASQGREWDTVILSVVDSEHQTPWFCNSKIPTGLHTINTAISRVKRNLIIVCDTSYWIPKSNTQLIGALLSRPATKNVPPPPQESLVLSWEEDKEKYQIGIENDRLQTAVKEQNQIFARFASNIMVTPNKSPYASVYIKSSSSKERTKYKTTLFSCTCADFTSNLKGQSPCKHSFALALKLRLIDSDGTLNDTILVPSVNVDIIK